MFMTDVKTHFSWSRLQAFLVDDEELELSLPHTPHSKYHSPGYLAKVVKTKHCTQRTVTPPVSKLFRLFRQYFKAQSDKNEPK